MNFIKNLVFLLLFISNLYASQFYLNPYFAKKLQKNSKSYNIIKDYVRFLNTLSKDDTATKILKVNDYINRISPQYDTRSEDYWATPFEFLSRGGGDCEDYAIAKMYSLEKLGISQNDMYLSAVKDKYQGGDHMVLGLKYSKTKQFVLLDNLSFRILPVKKRTDLKMIFEFNKNGFYRLNNYENLVKTKDMRLPQYIDMKARDKKQLILSK